MVRKFIDPVCCRRMKAIITKGFSWCCLIFNDYLKTGEGKWNQIHFLKKKIQKGVKDNHTSWLEPFVDGPDRARPQCLQPGTCFALHFPISCREPPEPMHQQKFLESRPSCFLHINESWWAGRQEGQALAILHSWDPQPTLILFHLVVFFSVTWTLYIYLQIE